MAVRGGGQRLSAGDDEGLGDGDGEGVGEGVGEGEGEGVCGQWAPVACVGGGQGHVHIV